MRSVLAISLTLLTAACDGEGAQEAPLSDASRYAAALDAARPLPEALRLCGALAGGDASGDCATAAMEARGRMAPEDCAALSPGRWQDECWFLLAERLAEDGQVAEGLELCMRGRYSRECTFHLLRSEAAAGAGEPVEDAARRLAPFADAWATPDAAALYWREWFRAGQRAGVSVDADACLRLPQPTPCRGAAKELWRAAMRALRPEAICAALADGRPPLALAGGAPAFAMDEAMQAEVAGRCPGVAGG